MSTDLEPRLRELFTAQASAVTSQHIAAVTERDYPPRRGRPVPLLTAGLVAGAAVAAVVGVVTSGATSAPAPAHRSVPQAADGTSANGSSSTDGAVSNTIALAGYTITLPASFDARPGTCTIPLPDGTTRPGKPGAYGACAAAWESDQPPSWMRGISSGTVTGPDGPVSSTGPHTPVSVLVEAWTDRGGAQITATAKIFFGDDSIKYAIVSIGMPNAKTVTGEQLDAAVRQAVAQTH